MEDQSQTNQVLSKNAEEKQKILEAFANIVDNAFGDLNLKDLGGKKFSEEFQFDGIPVWWFYRRLITSHVLPKQFNTASLVKRSKIHVLEKGYYQILKVALQKYFHYNESIKLKITRKESVSSVNTENNRLKKVLFLSYTNHVNKKTGDIYRINSVLNLLKQEKKVEPFTLFVDPISSHAYRSHRQLKYLKDTLYQYIGTEEHLKAGQLSKELYQKWCSLQKEKLFGEKWETLQYTLNFFFSQEFIYNTILYYLASKRVLQEQSVQCIVITATTGYFERSMIAAAAKLDVPLVIIQHGEGLATSNPELFSGMKVAIGVFGEKFAKRLTQWGIDRKDIELLGPVAFEEIHSFIQQKQKKNNKILFITTSLIEGNRISKEEYFKKIKNIVHQLSSLQKEIVIKLHPAERHIDEYLRIIKEEKLRNITVTQERGSAVLYNLINKSDLVVNLYSTVALQAMILGKPIISLDITVPSIVPNVDDGIWNGGIQITMDDDISKAAAEALRDPPLWKKKREEMVELYCYKIDGKENERLRDLIYKMAG